MNNQRQPRGIPTGGQFAASSHSEPETSLNDWAETPEVQKAIAEDAAAMAASAEQRAREVEERRAIMASEAEERKAREAQVDASVLEATNYAFPDGGDDARASMSIVRKNIDQPRSIREAAVEAAASGVASGNTDQAQGYLRLAGWASSKMDAETGGNTQLVSVGEEIRVRADEIRKLNSEEEARARREAIRNEGGITEARERAREFVEDVKDEVSDFRVSEFDPSKVSAEDDNRPSWVKRLFGGRK